MTEQTFQDDIVDVNRPLKSPDEEATIHEELPPPYEYPKIDFNSGWKDRAFGIVFWIQTVVVIIVAVVLSILYMPTISKQISFPQNVTDQIRNSTDPYLKPFMYALGSSVGVSILMSLLTYFALQLCAGRIIICTLIISIVIELLLVVVLLITVHWVASILPFCLLLFTLIFFACFRKRIPFAEVHLRVGCAVLRSRPSLILLAFIMIIVQILWAVVCFCMAVGVENALQTNNDRINTTKNNQTNTTDSGHSALRSIIRFFMLLSWYWGASVFGNILHFVTACAVGHWWFGNNSEQQYSLGTSIKRAFTTNFGTICLGSLLEAILKAIRSEAEGKQSKNIFACIAVCILRVLEKIIGYINEWGFIYAALTGQSFTQASRSFIELFKKRGWTMIINDTIITQCLSIINLLIGLTSATVSGLIIYIFLHNSSVNTFVVAIVAATLISFLLGLLFSAMTTTILTSCIRTVFVCFALNPAALGATHPEDLQLLTKVWHKFYPQEFTNSGYANYYPIPNTPDNV